MDTIRKEMCTTRWMEWKRDGHEEWIYGWILGQGRYSVECVIKPSDKEWNGIPEMGQLQVEKLTTGESVRMGMGWMGNIVGGMGVGTGYRRKIPGTKFECVQFEMQIYREQLDVYGCSLEKRYGLEKIYFIYKPTYRC